VTPVRLVLPEVPLPMPMLRMGRGFYVPWVALGLAAVLFGLLLSMS
jgi:hypothetical protein